MKASLSNNENIYEQLGRQLKTTVFAYVKVNNKESVPEHM